VIQTVDEITLYRHIEVSPTLFDSFSHFAQAAGGFREAQNITVANQRHGSKKIFKLGCSAMVSTGIETHLAGLDFLKQRGARQVFPRLIIEMVHTDLE
jgi:hypothetical protein